MKIAGRTALVTGGGAGIGRDITRQLVAKGARVIIVGRDEGRLAAVAAEHPGVITPLRADISVPADIEHLIASVTANWAELSLLINNAAVQTTMDFANDSAATLAPAIREEIAVNLTALIELSAGLLPVLRAHPSAAIMNISSGLAVAPKRSAPVYCATKAAVRNFTKAFRYQCEDAAPHVRVVDVIMALVDTEMTRGRGRGKKMSASAAAQSIIEGIERERGEIWVEKAKVLRVVNRLLPSLGERILRNA